MKLSVIIPNHNNEIYLRQCIDSILNQHYRPHEIIIFDDASTDGSKMILQEYERLYKQIKVIYSEKNVGVSAARHEAILKSTGNYITMIDSDDFYYDKNKLKKEMELIKYYKDNFYKDIIAYSKTVYVDEDGNVMKLTRLRRNDDENIRFKILTRLAGKYVPRDFCVAKNIYLDIGGYDEKMNLYEDWDLNIRLLDRADYYFSDSYGTAYRQRKGGLSAAPKKKHYVQKKYIFKKNRNKLSEKVTWYEVVLFYFINIIAYIRKTVMHQLNSFRESC